MEKKTKYILLGLGTVATLGAGAIIYLNYQKKKVTQTRQALKKAIQTESLTLPEPTPSTSTQSGSRGFPLKKGSRGRLVTNLQNALIKKYGANILPRYGADGHFGSETVNALRSKGLPTTVSTDTFSLLILGEKGSSTIENSIETLAKEFHTAIRLGNFSQALQTLQLLKDVATYTQINATFKKTRAGLVRKTLVTALLDRFKTSEQKKQINTQLYRIGLKYDGRKWALSGINELSIDQLVTTESTKVWDKQGRAMQVPTSTILGEYLDANNGVTQFETLDRKRLYVKTTSIKYAP
jgi:hypothetical protein